MKGKISRLQNLGIVRTAVITGQFNGKTIELGVTNTNTTWSTVFGKKAPKVGEEVEVDDTLIQESTDQSTGKATGRYMIQRAKADKVLEAAKMLQAEQLYNAGQA
jgi:hypothetical protein